MKLSHYIFIIKYHQIIKSSQIINISSVFYQIHDHLCFQKIYENN